jgi:hypothetical protein
MRHNNRDFFDWLIPRALGVLFIVGVLAVNFGCQARIWNECRAVGHSKFYCWRMVFR